MAKKKGSNSGIIDSITESATDSSKIESKAFTPNPDAENAKTIKPRFSVTLKEDGSLDYESMRSETRERLREILKDPKTQELFGDAAKLPEVISDEDVKMLYDLVSTVEAYAFSIAGKIDFDIANKHARFTPEQKAMLIPSTKNVIIKNADKMAFMLRWKDEVVLAGLLLMLTRAKYEGARKEQSARNEAKRTENPATQETAVM